jgi:hypothetical protein
MTISVEDQRWNFITIYMGAGTPGRNRVVVPARRATYAGGINSLELIPGLLKNFLSKYTWGDIRMYVYRIHTAVILNMI